MYMMPLHNECFVIFTIRSEAIGVLVETGTNISRGRNLTLADL